MSGMCGYLPGRCNRRLKPLGAFRAPFLLNLNEEMTPCAGDIIGFRGLAANTMKAAGVARILAKFALFKIPPFPADSLQPESGRAVHHRLPDSPCHDILTNLESSFSETLAYADSKTSRDYHGWQWPLG